MKKLKEFKLAIRNQPPQRLAKIEYQSHMLQMMGITVVCAFLIAKGYWYIIFAFVFGLGISYSQGMTAYAKYRNIMGIIQPEKAKDYLKDKSPSRKKSKIIKYSLGSWPRWLSVILSVVIAFFITNPTWSRFWMIIAYLMIIGVVYTILYFYIFYYISLPIYRRKLKNEKTRKDIHTKRN